ncbi:MAG TPA: restriction endonuclease subunit S [Thermodesulfobacteriota bacterium]|nr:restriction endonuclease subunit S [Thermodesulfobacteriota bacterium]
MKLVQLGQVAEIEMGQAPSGDTYNENGDGLPLIAGASDFGELTPHPSRFTSHPTKKSKNGDILICIRATIGNLNWSDSEYCLGRGVAGLRAKEGIIAPQYLWRVMEAGADRLAAKGRGATFRQVTRTDIAELEIPLPPLNEQMRIAAILDQADKLRRLRQSSIDRLNELGQAIFYEMFGDPATNPMGWPMGTIGDLTESTQYGTSSKAGNEGSIPILRMGNITTTGEFEFQDMKFIDLLENEIDKYTVKDGDILFNRTNSPDLVGKTGVYRGEKTYAYAGYLIRLRTNKEAVPEYIGTYLNSKVGKKILRGMCKTIIGMANINAKELRTIPIPLAPIELQKKFQRKFVAYRSAIPAFQKHREHLDTLFSSLQHREFHGEM